MNLAAYRIYFEYKLIKLILGHQTNSMSIQLQMMEHHSHILTYQA